jgi:hypothetical protein
MKWIHPLGYLVQGQSKDTAAGGSRAKAGSLEPSLLVLDLLVLVIW